MEEIIKSLEEIRNTCKNHFYTQEGCKECPLGTSDGMCNVIKQKIERRPKGEWQLLKNGRYICPECGTLEDNSAWGFKKRHNYCWNCGAELKADMRGEIKHPTAKTVPRMQAVDFINDESNGCFIGSIDVDNEWVTLIFK